MRRLLNDYKRIRLRRKNEKKDYSNDTSLVLIFGETISANADGLYTSGGKSNKYWSMSIGKTSHGGILYRITGYASQPEMYKFDSVSLKVVHFCNSNDNQVKSVSAQNTYHITASADAAYGSSASRGSSCLKVKDDTYGQGTKTIYYK